MTSPGHLASNEVSDEHPATPSRTISASVLKDTPLKLARPAAHSQTRKSAKCNKTGEIHSNPSEGSKATSPAWQDAQPKLRATASEFTPQVPAWPQTLELVQPPQGLDVVPWPAESGFCGSCLNGSDQGCWLGELCMPQHFPSVDTINVAVSLKTGMGQGRHARILQLVTDALNSEDSPKWQDREGYVPISKLLRVRNELQREAFGRTKAIVTAVEQSIGIVRLDQERRRIRLQTHEELIRTIAEKEVEASPDGLVSFSEVGSSLSLIHAFAHSPSTNESPEDLLMRALKHEDCQLSLQGTSVTRRSRREQLQRIAEELFSDGHLRQDHRLRAKIADTQHGEVPLTWLCSKYAELFGFATAAGAYEVELAAKELCELLQHSEVIAADAKRLVARRKLPLPISIPSKANVPGIGGNGTGAVAPTSPPAVVRNDRESTSAAEKQRIAGSARAASQLKQLLDFYFEPFTLQHNRYLLDLILRNVGPPSQAGPWVAQSLRELSFGIEDLTGLDRIASAFSKLKCTSAQDQAIMQETCGQLKHLMVNEQGLFQLRSPPEIRSFVRARTVTESKANAAARYLSAVREQRGEAPEGVVSVLSCAVAAPLADDASEFGQRRLARLKRQLLLHRADLICLQGLNTETTFGASLTSTLSEEGYGFRCAKSHGTDPTDSREANAIFWDRSRWEHLAQKECGAALAVDLQPFEEPSTVLRAVCFRPRVPLTSDGSGLREFFQGPPMQLVCADLTLLGGAQGACVVEELANLPSVSQEVLDGEIEAPLAKGNALADCFLPLKSQANGLNRLHCPDAVMFQGMSPIVALSGHTEGYLRTREAHDLQQQFPAFRMPIVAAFDRKQCYNIECSKAEKRVTTRHCL